MRNPLPPPTTNARGGLIIVMAFTVVLGNIVAATPAHAADTYTGSRTCVSTKTPQSYTPLASSSGADYILHRWRGSGGWVSRNWTTTKVWSRTTGYYLGSSGTVSAQTSSISAQTSSNGVFYDSAASMTCIDNPV